MRVGFLRTLIADAAVLFAVQSTAPAFAHHSQASFDRNSVLTLRGNISRYEWQNPHVYIYLNVGTDEPVEWQLEGDPTPVMTRSGWRPDTLAPGDAVIVRAHPDMNRGRNHGLLMSLTTPGGVVLTPRATGKASSASATDISGVWDGLRGFATRRFVVPGLTAKAAAAQAAYDESKNPVKDCRAYPTPSLVTLPFLNQIEIRGDRILMRSEFFKVERTIYMDGRGHPANGERTNQGHSIGHWSGDVLVVDTTLFTDSPVGTRPGIASGAGKHVVERFALSKDRTQLLIDFTVEDPEYLAAPMTGSVAWDFAPDGELLSFDCNPENARVYALD